MCVTACAVVLGTWHTGQMCKTAKPIEMPFGETTCVGLRNLIGAYWIKLDPLMERECAAWPTIKCMDYVKVGCVCGGDAPLYQITLGIYLLWSRLGHGA